MKFIFVLTLLGASFSWAAQRSISAAEILNLPSENRRIAALDGGPDLYKDLRSLSQNQQQTMSIRWKALMLMTEVNPKESVRDLVKATTSPEWFMRNAGLVGLQSVHKERALEVAQDLIKDKALVVRSAAVEFLSQNLSPLVRDLFWQELFKRYNYRAEQSLWIRPQILKALVQKPQDRESKIFVQLLKERNLEMQYMSTLALEQIYGVRLGREQTPPAQKVALWQEYARKKSL